MPDRRSPHQVTSAAYWVNCQPAPDRHRQCQSLRLSSKCDSGQVADPYCHECAPPAAETPSLGKFLADTAYTAQQLTILLEIDHRDQSITHFHSQRIFQLYIVPRRFDNGIILCHFYWFWFGRRFLFTSADPPGQSQQSGSEQQKYQVRHSGAPGRVNRARRRLTT